MWHGSTIDGITSFKPGSHFGGKTQALLAIVAAQELDGKKGKPTLYSCRLEAQAYEICRLPDWGTPKYQGILLHYMAGNGALDKFRNEYYRELRRNDCPSEERSLEFLLEEAGSRGHAAIVYSNEVELVGEDSFCVIDPLRVVIGEESHPTENEIVHGLSGVYEDNVGFDADEWAKILLRLGRSR